MAILVVGNLGYIGTYLVPQIKKKISEKKLISQKLIGFDIGYFSDCILPSDTSNSTIDLQIIEDIRNVDQKILDKYQLNKGQENEVDTIVYLTAISNDPMSKKFPQETYEINFESAIKLAQLFPEAHFIYASSCSVYGQSNQEILTESSPVQPLTDYAKSKVLAEQELNKLHNLRTTIFRFATACGFSPRYRTDLLLNNFVAGALVNHKIPLIDSGQTTRPLVDIRDFCEAIIWAISRFDFVYGQNADNRLTKILANVGSNSINYKVAEYAKMTEEHIPDSQIDYLNKDLHDFRSYHVDFSYFQNLAQEDAPKFSTENTIENIKENLTVTPEFFSDFEEKYRAGLFNRLLVLDQMIDSKKLSSELRFI